MRGEADRRVMDRHHAEQAFVFERIEQRAQFLQLRFADLARRHERRGDHTARHADQRKRSAPPRIGKAFAGIAAHMRAPFARGHVGAAGDINVVIAWDEADVVRRSEARQPVAAARIFRRQADIGDVTGDGDMVRLLRLHIGDEPRQHRAVMHQMPLAPPVQPAGQPLAGQFTQARRRQRRQMRIGQMGEGERHPLRA